MSCPKATVANVGSIGRLETICSSMATRIVARETEIAVTICLIVKFFMKLLISIAAPSPIMDVPTPKTISNHPKGLIVLAKMTPKTNEG